MCVLSCAKKTDAQITLLEKETFENKKILQMCDVPTEN